MEDTTKKLEWVFELESRLQRRQPLAHDIGAGAKCLNCKDKCPGLDLHFWRKSCRSCKCSKEAHDIPDDDNCRFNILFKGKPIPATPVKAVLEIKVKEKVPNKSQIKESVKSLVFDWIPPTSLTLAADYMNELPESKLPISGSEGANLRKMQLQKQIPLHDLMPSKCDTNLSDKELAGFNKCTEKLKKGAGIGIILRVKQLQSLEESKALKMQPPQKSMNLSQNEHNLQNVNVGVQNINLQPPNSFFQSSASAFSPIRPLYRPQAFYLDSTPRSVTRGLPQMIPSSILRLPSSFRPPVQASESGWKQEKCDNEQGAMGAGNEFAGLEGIYPLPAETNENDISQPLTRPGTSTPVEKTAAETEGAQNVWDRTPLVVSANIANVAALESDLRNANEANGIVDPEAENRLVDSALTCVKCKLTIEFGTPAVFIKEAPAKAWHPKCFVCKDCEELLVDLIYFYHKGLVYCGRHYTAKLKIPRCSMCDELIFVKRYTKADDQCFHVEHFCCADCEKKLADNDYLINDLNNELPTCLPCYAALYAKKCFGCKLPVMPFDQRLQYEDLVWHTYPDCFQCALSSCHKSLVNEKFLCVKFHDTRLLFCSKQHHFDFLICQNQTNAE